LVAVLTHYVNNRGGSLLTATSTIQRRQRPGMLSSQRSLMIAAGVAALGLIAYTLYIPPKGIFPGFGPYGSGY
jgi:hypothetical protein